MIWRANLFSFLLFGSAVASSLIALFAWRRRAAPGARPLVLLSLAVAVWSAAYGVGAGYSDLSLRILYAKIQYLGISLIPLGFLTLVFQYTGRPKRAILRRTLLGLMGAAAAIICVLAWTSEFHTLLWRDLKLVFLGEIPVLKIRYGPAFWLNVALTYSSSVYGFLLLFFTFRRSFGLRRKQSAILITGFFIPWLFNLFYIIRLGPLAPFDLTPIAYALTCIVFSMGLFRFGLLDLAPIARETIIEEMKEGVIVIDPRGRAVDANPALLALTGKSSSQILGLPPEATFPSWPWNTRDGYSVADRQIEFTPGAGLMPLTLELHRSPLRNRSGEFLGFAVLIRDISERKRMEKELIRTARTDSLTGLRTRGRFFEIAREVFQRALDDDTDLSVLMIDADHFKFINDRHGHAAGDAVLRAIADRIARAVRSYDVLGRYGGEEFSLLLPDSSAVEARAVAEKILNAMRASPIEAGGLRLKVSVSIGIASLKNSPDESFDQLLDRADAALYLAKNSGRDRALAND